MTAKEWEKELDRRITDNATAREMLKDLAAAEKERDEAKEREVAAFVAGAKKFCENWGQYPWQDYDTRYFESAAREYVKEAK